MKLTLITLIKLSILLGLISCSKNHPREERRLRKVTSAFAGHLYLNYHRYNQRERKDNVGKFKNTWPLSPYAHNPHSKMGKKRMKPIKQ